MNHNLLTDIEKLIHDSYDVKELLIKTCKILSVSGDYSWCWIGLSNKRTGCIEPISQCGSNEGYLKKINIPVNQKIFEELTPSGKSFNVVKFYVKNNIWTDPVWNEPPMLHLKKLGFPAEFNSVAVFPLIQNLSSIGAVYLYSDKINFFLHDELILLELISLNLSYALDNIESAHAAKKTYGLSLKKWQKDNELEYRFQAEKLAISFKKAEEVNRLKSNLLANISQKIRTPLNSIIGFVDLLDRKNNSDYERQAYNQLIVSQSKYLLKTLNELLQITKLDSQSVNPDIKTISFSNLLHEIYSEYQIKLKNKKNIELVCTDAPLKLEYITTDKYKFRQIFTILLDHALTFTNSGKLKFGYYSHNKTHLTCFVSYFEIEANVENIHDIFDIFSRTTDNSNYFELTICQGNARLLGGDIWLETDPEKGSTIFFTIEYPFQGVNSSKILNHLLRVKHWRTNEVLLIEDDLCTIEYLTIILTQIGLKIYVAHDGKETQKYYQILPQIDLVLLDVSLPDVNGLELVKQMKIIRKDIPVIAQTAMTVNDEGKELSKAGCDAYITKPYKRDQVLSVIKSFMTI